MSNKPTPKNRCRGRGSWFFLGATRAAGNGCSTNLRLSSAGCGAGRVDRWETAADVCRVAGDGNRRLRAQRGDSRVENEGEVCRSLPAFPHFSLAWQRAYGSSPEDEKLTSACTCGGRYPRGEGVGRSWGGRMSEIEELIDWAVKPGTGKFMRRRRSVNGLLRKKNGRMYKTRLACIRLNAAAWYRLDRADIRRGAADLGRGLIQM